MKATSKKKLIDNSDLPELANNPFPGLRPFSFDESSLFYGRDSLSDQIIDKLLANKFVCLLGGAGAGKTSLIEAGIKPIIMSGLIDDFETKWHVFNIVPGLEPKLNLSNEIFRQEYKDFFDESRRIQEHICHSIIQRGRHGLVELLGQLKHPGKPKYLFIIDRFEDLFRFRNQNSEVEFYEEALQFVNLFLEALQSDKFDVNLLISIRSDFTDDCVMFPKLAQYINQSNVMVPRLNRDQFREALLGPLRALGIRVEDSLVSQVLNDISTIDNPLPRFQHAMRRTWEMWTGNKDWEKPVSQKDYEETGGIQSSIAKQANAVFEAMDDDEQRLCETIFKSMTERGSENKGFSRSVKIDDLVILTQKDLSEVGKVIDIFSKAGLIVYDELVLQGSTSLELSNITLIGAWDRLREWVEDEAISGQMYKQLAVSSAAYQVGKTGLLRPPDLQLATNWKEKQNPTLQWARRYNPAFERTMVYLRTSQQAYETEEAFKNKKARRAFQKVRSFSLVLGGTAALAVMLTIYSQFLKRKAEKMKRVAIEQRQEADTKTVLAEQMSKEALAEKGKAMMAMSEAEKLKFLAEEQSKALAEQKSVAEYYAQQAMQHSAQSEQNLKQVSKQKDQIEQTAQQANIQKSQAERDREETSRKRLLTIAQSLASKSVITPNATIKALLALHSYGFIVKNGGVEATPDLYNALGGALSALGQPIRIGLKGHSGSAKALAASAKGTLYSAGSDGRVLAWNMNEANPSSRSVARSTQGYLCLSVSSNGKYLAVGSDNGSIQLLNLNSNDAGVSLKGHEGSVYSVEFSLDGQTLYSSGSDKKILAWSLPGNTKTVFADQTAGIRCLSMSPDGHTLAGGAENGTIILWDTRSGQSSVLTSDDPSPVYSLAFNNSGTVLASGDLKGKVKLWNPQGRRLSLNLRSHGARVAGIAFSPIGDLMATSSYDGSIYLFDLRNIGTVPTIIREPSSWVLSVAFSSDGKRLVVATNKPDYMAVYPAQTKTMFDQLCPKINRGFTTEEWNTYIGSDIGYEKPCE